MLVTTRRNGNPAPERHSSAGAMARRTAVSQKIKSGTSVRSSKPTSGRTLGSTGSRARPRVRTPVCRRRRSQEPEGGSADGRTDTWSMLYAGDEMSFSPKEEGISDTLQRARTLTARRGEMSPSQTLRDQSQGEPGRPDAQRQNVPRRLLATA